MQPIPISDDTAWQAADLRALPAAQPANLLAVYARDRAGIEEIRLDLASLTEKPGFDLWVALNFEGGGMALPASDCMIDSGKWDAVIRYSDAGLNWVLRGQTLIPPANAITIDPTMDYMILRLPERRAHSRFGFQVCLSEPSTGAVLDRTDLLWSDGPTPQGRARLLLAFKDVLPAASPAQALRRWDGAHTGPFGQRHGLYRLLLAAQQNRIPLALLDLRNPASLHALEALGGLDIIRDMQQQGLLILPNLADPALLDLQYSPLSAALRPDELAWGSIPLDNIPDIESYVGRTGITTEGARQLNQHVSSESENLLIWGGSLPESPLADSSVAPRFFQYLAEHPWIEVMDAADLRLSVPASPETLPPACQNIFCQPETPVSQPIYDAFANLPLNNLTPLAFLAAQQLTQPASEQQTALQNLYLPELQNLFQAVHWASSPVEDARCNASLCYVSSPDWFIVVDPYGGRLALAAYRDRHGQAHLWLAPTFLFAPGLSDPSTWNLKNGILADPASLPGGLLINASSRRPYSAQFENGELILKDDAGTIKSFQIINSQLKIHISSPDAFETRMPLFAGKTAACSLTSNIAPLPKMTITGSAVQITSYRWDDSAEWMQSPEDPDRAYPPGHYLTCPFEQVNIQSDGELLLVLDAHQTAP